jgi:hypothetical protein
MPSRSIRDGRQGGMSRPTTPKAPMAGRGPQVRPQSLGGQTPNRGSVAAGNSLINQTGVGARPAPISNSPGPVGPIPVAPVQQMGPRPQLPINAPTATPMVNTQPVIGSRPVTR